MSLLTSCMPLSMLFSHAFFAFTSGTEQMRCRNTLSPGKEQPISSGLHQRNETSRGITRFGKLVGKCDMLLMQYASLLFLRFFSGSGETERYTKVSRGETKFHGNASQSKQHVIKHSAATTTLRAFLFRLRRWRRWRRWGLEEGGGRTMWFRFRRWRKWRR